MLSKLCKCYLLLTSHYRRAAEKEGGDEMSLDDHKPSLAIENNAYATVNDTSKSQNP